MRSVFLLTLILGTGTTSLAATPDLWYVPGNITQSSNIDLQPLRCPTIGKDHSQMIGELHALQDKIKGDANCGKLVANLEQIGQLSGDRRNVFLETVAKMNAGQAVRDNEMQNNVIKYAQDVTVAAGSLATLLTQSQQCFGSQDVSTSLFALSSFVNEASTLLSSVAGPWGPALSIGGKVVAGFLNGVDKFIQSMPGYDFKDKKEWQGYVETLCSFHEQQDEIYAMIHPESAIQSLDRLNFRVTQQLTKALGTSPLGPQLYSSFQAQDDQKLGELSEAMNIETQSEMGLQALRLLSAQRWILQRIESIKVESKDPLAPGQYLVQKQRDEIEEFLIAKQGPKFIDFQLREAGKSYQQFEEFIYTQGLLIFRQLEDLNELNGAKAGSLLNWPEPEDILGTLLKLDENQLYGKGHLENELYSSLVYFKRELGKRWDSLNINYGVKSSFCVFFERAGYYSQPLRSSCNSRSAGSIEAAIAKYSKMGLSRSTPQYLKRAAHYQGLNWTESLDVWLNQLK